MRRFVFLVVAAMTAVTTYGQSSGGFDSIENYVSVTGKAEKFVEPNRFEVQVTIDEKVTKGKVDVKIVEAEMVKRLNHLGVDCEKDLQIKYISSAYMKRKGAMDKATYILSLRDGALLQRIYDALGELDITAVSLSKSYNSDQSKYETEVRREALLNAKRVASDMAMTIGQEIGACFYMQDNMTYGGYSRSNDVVMVGYAVQRKESAPVYKPLRFEKQKISATVSAKFLLVMPNKSQLQILR